VVALKSGGRLDLARVFGDLRPSGSGPRAIDCLSRPMSARRSGSRLQPSLEIARVMTSLVGAAAAPELAAPARRSAPASLPLAARRASTRRICLSAALRAAAALSTSDDQCAHAGDWRGL